uniref:Uncharacterized protein n=1 Tax=Ciona intestinalis TaxID=7719 RepID=H2XLN6_CIOIN
MARSQPIVVIILIGVILILFWKWKFDLKMMSFKQEERPSLSQLLESKFCPVSRAC